jgi:hypothetical protein
MKGRLLVLAATLLTVATGCGSHSAEHRAAAALAAETTCESRLAQQLHLHGTKVVTEGFFVSDLSNGRLRLTGKVPTSAHRSRAESYTCVVASGSSGLSIVSFHLKRTT